MKKAIASWVAVLVAIVVLLFLTGAFYVVSETEQAVITQFGKPVGQPITTAGVHFKTPFVQHVTRFEKRVLEWDGPAEEMATKDKLYIIVDAFGRWRIKDPLQFFLRLRDEPSALSRLNDILGSEMRNTIARHELVELVRTTKNRRAAVDDPAALPSSPIVSGDAPAPTTLPPIEHGRVALEAEVTKRAGEKLAEFGIELLNIRFKRVNYNPAVSAKIFERMMSERRQIAERFRSEGAGEAARVIGRKERDLKEIESEAYRKVQVLEGKADAQAIAIYAEAFNGTPEARDFYAFQRALETYRTAFARGTTVVLTTDSGFMRLWKGDDLKPSQNSGSPVVRPAVPQLPGLPVQPAPSQAPSPAISAPVPLER
jgi:membrane protease subunit HflC